METCENSSWVKKGADLVCASGLPLAREQKGCQAFATRAEAASGLVWTGPHAPPATDLHVGLRPRDLTGLLHQPSQGYHSLPLGKILHCSQPQFPHL